VIAQEKDTIGGKHVNLAWKEEVNKIFSKPDLKRVYHMVYCAIALWSLPLWLSTTENKPIRQFCIIVA
jgi:hypothetical protein